MDYQPEMPWTESERLKALKPIDLDDKAYQQDFDDLTIIASQICETPMALINLVYPDRQYSVSTVGVELDWIPTNESFCVHTLAANDTLTIPDTEQDPRFQKNAFVTGNPNLRFYAGAVMKNMEGVPFGAVCVLDTQPRELSREQILALEALSRQASRLFELQQSSAARRKQERLHKMISESAVEYAIISTDMKGKVETWNSGAERIMGWAAEDAIGQDIDLFFTEEDDDENRSEKEMRIALKKGSARDVRWHVKKSGEKFWADGRMMPLLDDNDKPQGFVKIVRDKTLQHNRTIQRKDLSDEIVHRLNNTITIARSLAQQTIRNSDTLEEAGVAVGQRLTSFANAQNILLQNEWNPEDIRVVISSALAPHFDFHERISATGPDVIIPGQRLVGLSLALHELITNSIKHGALSSPKGDVKISWTYDANDDDFQFSWVESGGPVVSEPVRKGFGSKILSSITSSYFGGRSELNYDPEGFNYHLYGSIKP